MPPNRPAAQAQLRCAAHPFEELTSKTVASARQVNADAGNHNHGQEPAYGPLSDTPSPFKSAILKKMGGHLIPIATLGPTEIIADNLLGSRAQNARWCLQPLGEMEVLVFPRRRLRYADVPAPPAVAAAAAAAACTICVARRAPMRQTAARRLPHRATHPTATTAFSQGLGGGAQTSKLERLQRAGGAPGGVLPDAARTCQQAAGGHAPADQHAQDATTPSLEPGESSRAFRQPTADHAGSRATWRAGCDSRVPAA